jgi:hypothetical protein
LKSKRDNQPNHKSEDFLLEREKKRIAECRPNDLLFIENEDSSYEIKNIKWPTLKEFTIDFAIQKIDEFMKTVS